MSINVCNQIQDLVAYAIKTGLSNPLDRVFLTNRLMEKLRVPAFEPDAEENTDRPLEEILGALCDYAIENGVIPDNGITGRDLFDTELMGILTPLPSTVIAEFNRLYAESPEAATDYYYALSCNSDYIRTYRVKKDLKWLYEGKYGTLDITVNLSKPEKDPKAIAAAKLQKQSGYPKCALCRENEGFAGSLNQAARASHRIIPITMAGQDWFLQYSPYVYYNEHCIVLSKDHVPMKIEKGTFERLLDFVAQYPHYFLGSNADLPIVGGSILSHDHTQGGNYTFAMATAPIETEIQFSCFDNVEAGIVNWPMSVIRLRSEDRKSLVELADKIHKAWRNYTDEDAFVYAYTDGEPHNTVTPIARFRDGKFELDLVLRNNITTEEHPLGVYHPHADLHNIKKENIGLIEVMGLAVLPARLRDEIATMCEFIKEGRDFAEDENIVKHKEWFEKFKDNYEFTPENTESIIKTEIGRTFERVLEDAGVYKCTEEGRAAFMRFIATVNA